MSGECKSFRLNDPMTWAEFMAMPDDLKATYIKLLRNKFNVPDSHLGEAMGVSQAHIQRWVAKHGLNGGRKRKKAWDKEGFYAWWHGATMAEKAEAKEEQPAEAVEEAPVVEDDLPWPWNAPEEVETCEVVQDEIEKVVLNKRNPVDYIPQKIVPESGSMTFTGEAYRIVESLYGLLGGANVRLAVQWEVLED